MREVIVQKPVKWEVKDGIGYININTFSETTGADVRGAIYGIDKSLGHKPLGYVVDLRDNGGGLLSQAIEVSDAFLSYGRDRQPARARKGRYRALLRQARRLTRRPAGDRAGQCRHRVARPKSSPARCRIITAR